jgi:hypothetical protein
MDHRVSRVPRGPVMTRGTVCEWPGFVSLLVMAGFSLFSSWPGVDPAIYLF